MSGTERLHLQDALEDSPQTKNFLRVFERDALRLKKYSKELHEKCHKVMQLQNELCGANQALSEHLVAYEKQRFPLESEDSILSSTLKQFAFYLDEINSVQQVLATQLSDGMMYPLNKFLQADISEVSAMYEMFQIASNEHNQAMTHYMKLKKKENSRAKNEANDEVFAFRKKFHQTSLHYYSALNSLQFKRKSALLEPFLGLLQAYRSFFQMGTELAGRTEVTEFVGNISACTQQVHQELGQETQKTVNVIESLELQSGHLYYPEPVGDMPVIPPNMSLCQKGGYLFLRSKQAILGHKWERCYFFTQGGNLMSQLKDEVAGGLAVDLNEEGVYAEPTDCEDRRYVFHIVSPLQKKFVILQAENERERDEWIAVVNRVIKEGGYVKDKPVKAGRSISSSSLDSKGRAHSTSSGHAQQSPEKKSSDQNINSKTTTPPYGAQGHQGFPVAVTPIQFDIISPNEEQRLITGAKEGPPSRINPFDQSGDKLANDNSTPANAAFSQVFTVRFLGSMEVQSHKGAELVHETIRQIMAARAIHNVFKMTESHLVVSSESMQLIDPANKAIRTEFCLPDVSYWKTHEENKRLFAFITRNRSAGSSHHSFACHVFECNTSGDEICQAIGTATKIAFQILMQQKAEKEKLEKENLEKLTGQTEKQLLLSNIQDLPNLDESKDDDAMKLSPDGCFVLLDNSSVDQEQPDSTQQESGELKSTE